jgi:Ring finger domain
VITVSVIFAIFRYWSLGSRCRERHYAQDESEVEDRHPVDIMSLVHTAIQHGIQQSMMNGHMIENIIQRRTQEGIRNEITHREHEWRIRWYEEKETLEREWVGNLHSIFQWTRVCLNHNDLSHTLDTDGHAMCMICMDPILESHVVSQCQSCLHCIGHVPCIVKWVEHHSTCPHCRIDMKQ